MLETRDKISASAWTIYSSFNLIGGSLPFEYHNQLLWFYAVFLFFELIFLVEIVSLLKYLYILDIKILSMPLWICDFSLPLKKHFRFTKVNTISIQKLRKNSAGNFILTKLIWNDRLNWIEKIFMFFWYENQWTIFNITQK